MRSGSAHEEGGQRDFSVSTRKFVGSQGRVEKLDCIRVKWGTDNGRMTTEDLEGTEFEIPAQLVLLAMGFLSPETRGMVEALGCKLDPRGNVQADDAYMTNVEGVFVAGDMRRGQSLIVWAIWEGRECAVGVDRFLMGYSDLPSQPQLLGRDVRAGV